MNPSRQQRRLLQRRADRLLARLSGIVVASPVGISPRSCVILLSENTKPVLVHRGAAQPALHAAGLHLDGLDEMLAEISRSPQDDGQRYPAIMLIDGWAQVSFVECTLLAPGGDA